MDKEDIRPVIIGSRTLSRRTFVVAASSLVLAPLLQSCGGGGGGLSGPKMPPPGTVVLKPNVRVIPADGSVTRTMLSASRLTLTGTELPSLAPGDVLACSDGVGFMGRITGVSAIDGGFQLDTEPVGLAELFEEINVSHVEPVPLSDLDFPDLEEGVTIRVEQAAARAGADRGRAEPEVLVLGFDQVTFSLTTEGSPTSVKVVVDGEIRTTYETIFDLAINDQGDVQAKLGIRTRTEHGIRTRGSFKVSGDLIFEKEKKWIDRKALRTIRIPLGGPIFIVIVIRLTLLSSIGINGELGGAIEWIGVSTVDAVEVFSGTANSGEEASSAGRRVEHNSSVDFDLGAFQKWNFDVHVLRPDFDFEIMGVPELGPRLKVGAGMFRFQLESTLDPVPADGVVPGSLKFSSFYNPRLELTVMLRSVLFRGRPVIGGLRLIEGVFPMHEPKFLIGGPTDVVVS